MPRGNGITLYRLSRFWSVGNTGTGSAQTFAHGLGPAIKFAVVFQRDTIGAANQHTVSWTDTLITVTATSGAVYDLMAYVEE